MVVMTEPVTDKHPDLVAFAHRLKAARLAAGMSQAELAERADLHRVSIARIEAGGWDVTLTTAGRLATALGIAVEMLVAGPASQPEPSQRPMGKRK